MPHDRTDRTSFTHAAVLVMAMGLSGCASKPGIIFDPANTATRWPPAPDDARIEYVGEIRTDADLKPGRGVGGAIRDFFAGKREPVGMVSPLGVCTDLSQRLFVADPGLQAVHVFDLNTRVHALWRPGKGEQPFTSPVAVAFDAHSNPGRVLVVDSAYAAVFAFDLKGSLAAVLGKGQLIRPVGIAVEQRSGRLLVADAGAHQIVEMAADGTIERRVGERGSGLGQFNFPTNIAIGPTGDVYVSDSLNFRIQVLGGDLSPRRKIGSKGDLPGYFAQPKGIAVDPEGHLYVVDAHFEAVQLFDASGTLLMSFGREGRGPGEFWLPAGIHVDGQGMIWIADSYNRRVQVFRLMQQGATP